MFDVIGVAILIVLMVLFGFLGMRAWKLKNAILKWSGSLLAGLLMLTATALLILGGIGFYKLNQHHVNPIPDIHITGTPEQIARGEQLANVCVSCHSPENQLPLSGTDFAAKFGLPPLGTIYAPNLTPAGAIKEWSDGEVIRAIREGVYKDGRSLLIMPSNNFRNYSGTRGLSAPQGHPPSGAKPGLPFAPKGLPLRGRLNSYQFPLYERRRCAGVGGLLASAARHRRPHAKDAL